MHACMHKSCLYLQWFRKSTLVQKNLRKFQPPLPHSGWNVHSCQLRQTWRYSKCTTRHWKLGFEVMSNHLDTSPRNSTSMVPHSPVILQIVRQPAQCASVASVESADVAFNLRRLEATFFGSVVSLWACILLPILPNATSTPKVATATVPYFSVMWLLEESPKRSTT